jgi:twitching motility two-component system response regulator PilH
MAKILIIDDEPGILLMYGDRLKSSGHEAITAKNGDEGIEIAKKEKPDLIFLDIIMPKVNGLDVLKQLKSIAETKNIPVYISTNLPEDSSGIDAKKIGAAGYLVKAQIEPSQFDQIITDALKGKG